jgi:hypothetical protein
VASNRKKRIDRPFASTVLAKAKKLATQYQVVIRFDEECREYYGRGLELPGALGDGKTPDACVSSTREAMVSIAAYMMERGETPPTPSAEGLRKVQLNVRVTPEEKLLFEEAARRSGQGLSDYIRSAALSGTARA